MELIPWMETGNLPSPVRISVFSPAPAASVSKVLAHRVAACSMSWGGTLLQGLFRPHQSPGLA